MKLSSRLALLVPGLLLVLSPLDRGGRGDLGLLLVHLLVLAGAAAWLAYRAGGGTGRRISPAVLVLALLLAAGGLSALCSDGAAFSSLLVLVDRGAYLLGLFLLLRLPWDSERATTFWRFFCMLPAALGVCSVGAFLAGWAARPAWPFPLPTQLGAYLAFGAVLSLALARHAHGGSSRWILYLASGLSALGLLATGSRGAALALGAGLLIWGALVFGARVKILVPALLLIVAVLAAVYGLRTSREGQDPFGHDRLYIWAAVAEVWTDHPVTGLGPGQLLHLAGPYQFPRELSGEIVRFPRRWSNAHSLYLQLLAEEGGLSVILFLTLLGVMARDLIGVGPRAPLLPPSITLPPLASLLAQGLVEDLLQSPALVWVALALYASALGRGREARISVPQRRAVLAAGVVLLWIGWAGVGAPWLAHQIAWGKGYREARLALACRVNPLHHGYPLRLARGTFEEKPSIDTETYLNALDPLRRAAHLAPRDKRVQRTLGRLHLRAHLELHADGATARRALSAYAKALKAAPTDPFLHLEAARARAVLGDRAGALSLIDEALQLEPAYLEARLEQVRLLGGSGRMKEARRAWQALEDWRRAWAEAGARTPYARDLSRIELHDMNRLGRLLHEQGPDS